MLTKPGKIIPIILVMTLLAVSVASVAAAPVFQGNTVEVTCVEDYEVQAGDWLSKIAVEYYGGPLLYRAIFEATNAAAAAGGDYATLANPDAIEVGQVLCIPAVEVAQALAAGGQAVMAAAGAAEEAAAPATAAIVISGDARLTTLAEALALTGLEETLTAPDAGPFTLFAPTDAAFENLPGGGLAWLQANPDRLAQVLRYHLVPVSLTGDTLEAMTQVDTVLGQPLDVTRRGGVLSVGGVTLNEANLLQTASGPVYVIDTVLLPPDVRADMVAAGEEEVAATEAGETATGEAAAGAGETAAEEAAAGAGEAAAEEAAAEAGEAAGTGEAAAEGEAAAGGLAEGLLSDLDQAGAPVEEGAGAGEAAAGAEEAAPEAGEAAGATEEPAGGLAEDLLTDLAQAGAPVEETTGAGEAVAEAGEVAPEAGEAAAGTEEVAPEAGEAVAEAGEVAPEAGEAAPEAQQPAGAEAGGSAGEPAAPPARPETAGEPAGSRVVIFNFAQVLAAATQSGRLQLNAPITIFAPTSNAFALLPQAELANLAADPVRLQNLLLNHVVPGAVWSADLAKTPTLNSLIGQPLNTSIENGKYMIEDAQVLAADFRFGNVIVHLIDKVLLPDETP